MARVLAFDFGLQRTGVAVGNSMLGTANALETVNGSGGKPDWGRIESLIKEWSPVQLVVGLPLAENGEENDTSRQARKFAGQLGGRFGVPVALSDERYTSIEASERLKIARQQGRKKVVRKEEVDQLAAVLIFENWFQDQSGL